ncbi:MAG TPA: class I SAM-dependent methyltransferase [Thermoanaerobaculia bacterium]
MTVWNDSEFTRNLVQATWTASITVQVHHNERATGDPARSWLSAWAPRYFVGNDLRVLVLGCGEGWLERSLAELPYIARIDACDFAAEAVERARAAAKDIPKIHYSVADLNTAVLEPGAYDVVLAHAVLHHIENLEHAFAQIERAMRPDATLILNEYVGPNRFQYSDDVLQLINELLVCLPETLRHGLIEDRLYTRRDRPTVEQMLASDPTEAVRAEELIPFIAQRFEVLDRRDLGGTILQHLLYDLAQNFRFDDPHERAYIELLCTIEAMLVDTGRIPSDFVLMAARKKGARSVRYDRPLPARPEAARDTERDPLRTHWRSAAVNTRGNPTLTPHHLRALRVALLSTQTRRANLFAESKLWTAAERLRARGTAQQWLDARYRAYGDDPAIRALLAKACTLAPHGG